jgi:DNA processing protein
MDGLVNPEDWVDDFSLNDAFYRGVWTHLAEPGDSTARDLIGQFGAERAFNLLLAGELASPFESERWYARVNHGLITQGFRAAQRHGVRIITPSMDVWPQRFNQHTGSPLIQPPALWVRGNRDALVAMNERSIALVGARAATGYGESVTMEVAAGLAGMDYAIVSGAAYGIDGMAHRATLAAGKTTIAFLAGGVDRFYPAGHDALLSRIVEVGAVISEVPCGVPPTKWRFLQRNRLIAAATQATVVIEAGWRSGSLNTASHASSLGRPVGAVPGPVTSATSAGCHRLIREFGATLVTNVQEMHELAETNRG